MAKIYAPIAAVLFGLLIFQLGNGLMGTLLPVRIGFEGFPTETAGLVASAYYAGLMAGALLANRVVALVGHIRAYASFAAIYASTALCIPIFDDPNAWYPLRALGGFCVAGMFMVIESWLNAAVDNKSRGRVLSTYMIVMYTGLGGGQFLLDLDHPLGFSLFSLTAICFALSLVPISLTRWPAPAAPRPEFLSVGRLYRLSPLALIGAFAAGLILSAFYGLTPVFAQNRGLDVGDIGLLMGIAILGGLAVQWPIGWWSDRFDRRRVMTVCLFVTALASLGLAATALRPSVALYILAGVFYCLSFVIYPLSLGHMNDHCAPDDRIAANAGVLLIYSAGASLGPIPASTLMDWLGDAALFVWTGAVAAGTGGYAIWRMTQRASVPLNQQEPYALMPRSSPMVGELAAGGTAAETDHESR